MQRADPRTIDGSGPAAYAEAVLPVSSKYAIQIFGRMRWIPPAYLDSACPGQIGAHRKHIKVSVLAWELDALRFFEESQRT
jgi:hypothetical protein